MCEEYNGWTNRETWAVALYINNDQGWQESVHDALRQAVEDNPNPSDEIDGVTAYRAGEIVRDNVEGWLVEDQHEGYDGPEATRNLRWQRSTLYDIGSLYRVNWDEIGAAFLSDITEG